MLAFARPITMAMALVVVFCCGVSYGDEPAAPEANPATQPTVSPEAQALLDQIRSAYANLESLELAGTISMEYDVAGQPKSHRGEFTAWFAAPNRFRHELVDDSIIVCDGTKASLYVPEIGRYTEMPAPEGRAPSAGLDGQVLAVLRAQNPSLLLAMSEDAAAELTDQAVSISRVDDQRIESTDFATLRVETEMKDVRFMIDPSTHLLRQVRVDMTRLLVDRDVPDVNKALMTIDYTVCKTGGAAAEERFAWTPPQGAILARNEIEAGLAAGRPDPSAMEGKAAPEFALKDLDDSEISLKRLRGSVVVLDFWATWCGPCRASLPHLDQLHRDFSEAGVKVFAVNLREDKAVAQKYMESNKLGLPVLLDSTGQVAQKFAVQGIPHTVVIDRKGNITKVMVGFGPGSEKQLREAVQRANGVR